MINLKPVTNVLLSILMIAVGCSKDGADPLPPATHTGAFTFGCKIDGKVYTARGNGTPGLVYFSSVHYAPSLGDSSIYISAQNTDDPDFDFDITIPFTGGTGTYSLKNYSYYGLFQNKDIVDTSLPSKSIYRTTDTDTGSVTITYFDGTYMPFFGGTILAGTFQMDAVNGEGKVIHITDGRFDIGK